MVSDPSAWRIRVTAHELIDPNMLLEHPGNYRAHPDAQQVALGDAIDELGFVGEVLVSRRSGRILDGHLRVALALKHQVATIPVGWVDCDDDAEEDRILASYDPLAALAVTDGDKLSTLLGASPVESEPLRAVLDTLIATARPKVPRTPAVGRPEANRGPSGSDESEDDEDAPFWEVIVSCPSEGAQQVLLERLTDEGWECRTLGSDDA